MQLTQVLFGSGTGLNPSIGPGGAAPPAAESAQSGGLPAVNESFDSDNADTSTGGGGSGTTFGYSGQATPLPGSSGSNSAAAPGAADVTSSRADRPDLRPTGLELAQPSERPADDTQPSQAWVQALQARVDAQQQALIASIGNAPKTIILAPSKDDLSNQGTSELSAAAERGYAQIPQDQPEAEQRFEAWT